MRQRFGYRIVASCESGPGKYEDRTIAQVECKGIAVVMAQAVAAIYVQVTVRHKNAAGLDVIDFTFTREEVRQSA